MDIQNIEELFGYKRNFVKTDDPVINHPNYYISENGIEVIDVI